MRDLLAVLVLCVLVASCQEDRSVGQDVTGSTTTLSVRVLRSASLDTSVYASVDSVTASLVAGTGYSETQTHLFSDHGCDFTKVPVGVSYTLTFKGIRKDTTIWSGTATGTTGSSGTTGTVGSSTAVTVTVSALSIDSSASLKSLTPTAGTLAASFDSATLVYTDSVATGATSETITAAALFSGATVAVNGGMAVAGSSSATVTLSSDSVVDVVVTNGSRTKTYTVNIRHKAATSSSDSIPWNSSITYDTLTDSRDGQVYRTVKIGTQTWMAQNLNYRNTTGSSDTAGGCYNNSRDSCAKYGRLYTWADVMDTSSTYNSTRLSAKLPHQGICPTGWHVPSDAEWKTLVQYVDSAISGTVLKSTSGWSSNTGTDAYGFRVLPAGDHGYDDALGYIDVSYNIGNYAHFWSSSEDDYYLAERRNFLSDLANADRGNDNKPNGFSLRCIAN